MHCTNNATEKNGLTGHLPISNTKLAIRGFSKSVTPVDRKDVWGSDCC